MSERQVLYEFVKSPRATLWYGFDWDADLWLTYLGSTVTIGDGSMGHTPAPTWSVDPESAATDTTPVVVSTSIVTDDTRSQGPGSRTLARLTGGTAGRTYLITALVTCSDGSVDERTFRIRCLDR